MKMELDRIKRFDLVVKNQFNQKDYLLLQDFLNAKNFSLPKEYVSFIKAVGFVYIMSPVKVKCASNVPGVSGDENLISIGRFLDWSEHGDFSIVKLMSMCSDQLPDNFIPFAEGASGDFYGFSIRGNESFISYWYHESLLSQQIYMVSKNFKTFLMNIKEDKIEDISTSESTKEKHMPSQKMIDLLKKTGKWKGD